MLATIHLVADIPVAPLRPLKVMDVEQASIPFVKRLGQSIVSPPMSRITQHLNDMRCLQHTPTARIRQEVLTHREGLLHNSSQCLMAIDGLLLPNSSFP